MDLLYMSTLFPELTCSRGMPFSRSNCSARTFTGKRLYTLVGLVYIHRPGDHNDTQVLDLRGKGQVRRGDPEGKGGTVDSSSLVALAFDEPGAMKLAELLRRFNRLFSSKLLLTG